MTTQIVRYDEPDDLENPANWTMEKRWWITILTALMTLVISVGSSIFSSATRAVAQEFNVSNEVVILSVSLYVAGFACGPLFFGPLSEIYGRRIPLLVGYLSFLIFQIPVGAAANVQTVLAGRFFAGVFGSAPLAICAGIYVDIWDTTTRGFAAIGFIAAVFIGPAAGPIAGDYIVKNSHLGWRWTAWMTMILGGTFFALALLTLPETLSLVILKRKAARLQAEATDSTINDSTIYDSAQHESYRTLVKKYGLKPVSMIMREPILLILTLYVSVVYGILYLEFFAFPFSFSYQRKWAMGTSSLPFISLIVGVVLACLLLVLGARLNNRQALTGDKNPERRLPPMIAGSIFMVVGLFLFAWTSKPSIPFWPQVISGVFLGCGTVSIFTPAIVYLMDIYVEDANSALAANTFIRSLIAAGFPLFATPMYEQLGTQWATSLLAFLCLGFAAFPVILFFRGKQIREWGTYTCRH